MRQCSAAPLGLALFVLSLIGPAGCKSKSTTTGPLTGLPKAKACLKLFERVKACYKDIAKAEADRRKLPQELRKRWVPKTLRRMKRSFAQIPKLCARAVRRPDFEETLKQTEACYRKSGCGAFARCYAAAAAKVGRRRFRGGNALRQKALRRALEKARRKRRRPPRKRRAPK